MTPSLTLDLPDLAATERLAARIAALACPGEAVLLSGTLGAGKSAFARAFVREWVGDPAAEVPSPTFTLVQPYDGPRGTVRSDERRVGEECVRTCSSRWSPIHLKNTQNTNE